MKVKELIKRLQKMPQELQVYMADHDHSEYEVSAKVNTVSIVDKELAGDLRSHGYVTFKGISDKKGFVSDADIERYSNTPERYIAIKG